MEEISARFSLLKRFGSLIDRAISMPDVIRIALVGSLTTEKANPKDADALVSVEDAADLTGLATAARKLKGAAQTKTAISKPPHL